MTKEKRNLESFKEDVNAKKQHEVDTALSSMKLKLEQATNRYKDLLFDFNTFKRDCLWLDILEKGNKENVIVPIEKIDPSKSREATAIAVGTDWHLFETVDPKHINGLNKYNKDIARSSVKNFFRAIIAWVDIHRNGVKVDNLVLALLGDFITNMLHDDQKEGNEGTPQEEMLFAYELIKSGIDYLLKYGNFKKIIVCCCDGNHGRDTDRIRHAGRSRHSHEWLLYNFLAMKFDEEKRITFNIAEGYHLYQEIYGKVFRFHHGDNIRYQGGVGGLTIPMNKAIDAWNENKYADFDIFGHWHQSINPVKFISVGSIIGYNAFALSIKARFEPPQQALILVDNKRFITSVNRLYVR